MDKSIGILDKDYILWVKELVKRYRSSQIKAAIKVNKELLRYYWELGKDIEEKQADNKYGSKFYATLSRDLRHEMPDVEGLSETSIRYAKRFYALYNQQIVILPQVVEESEKANLPQVVERLYSDLFSIPWGHHRYIIDKCSNDADKALFYVRQTLENGWSRDILLNVLDTNLYERSGKALTNFKNTLLDVDSDLAQELTRDPYDFSFTGLRGKYNERILKDAKRKKMENNRHLQFVLKHYREGAFDTSKAIDKFKKAAGRPNRGFIKYIAGIAAAAAVVLGIFIFNPQPQPVHFMTADAMETFILPDSTSVTLAPNSSLEFDARAYMKKSRSVRMEGKAFFDVTRNEKNPFEITTANAYVKVLGTSFQVDETADTEVYVRSGKVLFASAPEAEGVILTKGMGATLAEAAAAPALTAPATPNPAAWATGLFEYEATPLADVLDELSDFYGVDLKASDYDRKLSAKFETEAPLDDIIEMIATATEITITKKSL